jgi:NodT family efflux transporter outer membrane factor (OMF) lipoprotein
MQKPRTVHRALVPVAAALLVLGACSPRPEPVTTRAELPDSFSRTGDAMRPEPWWQAFDDPALTRLVERALAMRPSLRETWARLAQARATVGREAADRWPSLTGEADATRQQTGELREDDDGGGATVSGTGAAAPTGTGGGTAVAADDDITEEYSLGLSASYELDLWGRIDALADAARLDARATRQQLKAAALSLSGEVADTWYQLLAERARLDLLQRQLETNRTVERVVEVRVLQGQAGLADLLRQRELVQQTQEQIAAAEGDVQLRENELAVLVGRAPRDGDLPARRSLPDGPALPRTGVPAELIARRPDVQEAVLRVQAADKRVAAAIAERFPRIDLTGSLTTAAATPADLFTSWTSNLAAQLSVPLIDAGQRKAEVERSEAVVAERLAQFEDTALTALQEVEDALTRIRQQGRRVDRLDRQVQLARQSVERLRSRYVNADVDFLDVLDALTRVQDLERQLIDARRQRLAARVALARALAGDIEPPRPGGDAFDVLSPDPDAPTAETAETDEKESRT